jgi:hypothetical protein
MSMCRIRRTGGWANIGRNRITLNAERRTPNAERRTRPAPLEIRDAGLAVCQESSGDGL